MERPDLIFVTGCNAAGKSSLIRSHRSELPDYEVIMTDVYKSRSQDVFKESIRERKSIILETPFNNERFKDLIDLANISGYQSTLITLFLKSPAQSLERVANRRALENGLYISPGNVEHNFMENFKNVASFFPYFDESFFLYTGEVGRNRQIMRFEKGILKDYVASDLTYVQIFADQAYRNRRLNKQDLDIIAANKDYSVQSEKASPAKRFKL